MWREGTLWKPAAAGIARRVLIRSENRTVSPIANRAGPRASKAVGLPAWGIGHRCMSAGRPSNILVPRSGSRGSIASSTPGKSQVGPVSVGLLLARGGRKRQGSRRGAVSYSE